MRIYISGPMSGLDDDNRDEFSRMASLLQAKGHEPVNPHDIIPTRSTKREGTLPISQILISLNWNTFAMFCDACDGGETARGSRIEKGCDAFKAYRIQGILSDRRYQQAACPGTISSCFDHSGLS